MGKTKVKTIDMTIQPEAAEKVGKAAEFETEKQIIDKPTSANQQQATVIRKSSTKPKKIKKIRSRKYQDALEKIERSRFYPISEAIDMAKLTSYSKFDGSLDIHINTYVKGIRGLISLPFASGRKLTILAFGKGAEDSGADIVGDESKLAEIEQGKIDFDLLVATAEWMHKIAKLAKVLGPKGLMPNPKNGTVSDNLKKTVSELQGGKTEYKSEAKANVVHLALGKLNQPNDQLASNIKTLLLTIGKSKIKKVTLSPTMGPGVKLDLASLYLFT